MLEGPFEERLKRRAALVRRRRERFAQVVSGHLVEFGEGGREIAGGDGAGHGDKPICRLAHRRHDDQGLAVQASGDDAGDAF